MTRTMKKCIPFKTKLREPALLSMLEGMHNVCGKLFDDFPHNPSTVDTPERFVKYLAEYMQPINEEDLFSSKFVVPDEHNGMVIQSGIPFRMICEHHLLPAIGKAAVGYVPHGQVIGLSKIARVVDAVGTERPTLQEHAIDRIVELFKNHLKPKGIMVIIKAEHGCMACRGINKPGVETISSSVHGVFRDVASARDEFLSLINGDL